MDFEEVFLRHPVNKAAAMMLSGKHDVSEVTKEEILYILGTLKRKRELLNKAIGVTSKAMRKNLRWKLNKGISSYRNALRPRIVDEWSRNGEAIQTLMNELKRRNRDLLK